MKAVYVNRNFEEKVTVEGGSYFVESEDAKYKVQVNKKFWVSICIPHRTTTAWY